MAKKVIKSGYGESRNFGDPKAAEFPPYLVGRHVAGVRCEDLPADVLARLSVQHTDEDIAERNAGKAESGSGVRVTQSTRAPVSATEFGKQLEERRDFRLDSDEPWFAPNAMQEMADKHVRPGFRGKFLSLAKLSKEGARGYEIVKDAQGNEVRLGNMPLGEMPIELADKRNESYRSRSDGALRKIYQQARAAGVQFDEDVKQPGGRRVVEG